MSEPVEVVVIGPGAMGCLHAALLREAGVSVGLLDHRAERAALIEERGIIVERDGQERTVPMTCSADPADLRASDLAIVFVKAYDTEEATRRALPAIGDAASVLTLQNGLGNHELLAELVRPARVLAGTTTTGATLLGDGHVREAGRGFVQLGSPTGNSRRTREAVALFERAGLDCEATPSVDEVLWAKAIVNAAVNPLTALTGLRNGMLVEIPELREQVRAVVREAAAVARAEGVFVREDIVQLVEEICERTGRNRSSMLQDISAGRRTEIDVINGEIARRGDARGVAAPLCRILTALVHGGERGGKSE
ncbi:MAG: 2-dehydropantoate 2-reductase [Armatimonadota bacterium]|nr:2-dehydropantoate 2-reductase [Armatimonadota bacterium]